MTIQTKKAKETLPVFVVNSVRMARPIVILAFSWRWTSVSVTRPSFLRWLMPSPELSSRVPDHLSVRDLISQN